MAVSLKSAYEGAMVGALCGDAMGARFEWQTAAKIKKILDAEGGLKAIDYIEPWKKKRIMPAGHPTDDAELTALLAQALIDAQGFDPAVVYKRLHSFINPSVRKSFLTNGKAYGSGGTLRSSLAYDTYEESCAAFDRGEVSLIPSNGSLMRNTSAALFLSRAGHEDFEVARTQSMVTHRHPLCVDACELHAALMMEVLDTLPGEESYRDWLTLYIEGDGPVPNESKKRRFAPFLETPNWESQWQVARDSGEKPLYGSVVTTFQIALWALEVATDFRDGISKVIALGGDTDTYACVAGGLLGAKFGVEGIPSEWRDVLIGREIMIDLAHGLYALAGHK